MRGKASRCKHYKSQRKVHEAEGDNHSAHWRDGIYQVPHRLFSGLCEVAALSPDLRSVPCVPCPARSHSKTVDRYAF